MKKRRCFMCGEITSRPVAIFAQLATAPGRPALGAPVQDEWACRSCASLLEDGDDGEARTVDRA